ncbi:ammonia-forming cytochrome c nitrite reductase subunit c552 [Xiamenia xianingshaonis]|uniref:nitrite reductase (cytochrome; ammonia-forming) n=1 Tax=Xiamenia xianingshaonis TaxID=2682776 RepID=A0A9E6MQA4_9ACTN|nr:ammonia-forming cytochrome c nitrite reductase subunit c552 [Xiamenia xianingshaonis]NHM14517.1 ammonia-forming cytochrome c nitrite reductase subunit c552 [Xiamenia xianingshaonis]QTU83806.1 ammonia-forming cytochrome c nitrite reductase subunit c552 [Xiamenia xianingshaonis]
MKRSTGRKKVIAATACSLVLVAGLAACAAPTEKAPEPAPATQEATEEKPETTPAVVETPEPDEFGVVTAAMWKDAYPNEYATYMENEENSPEGKMNYLEEYPELNTMYKGYGFAKGYDEACSHSYSLTSINETPRVNEKTLANCITCKTPQFTAKVNAEGEDVYAQPFADLIGDFTEPISCYNCHENDPSKVVVTQQHFQRALGDEAGDTAVEAQTCGQCHNEYYFDPDTKYTTNPYVGHKAMGAEEILAYYNEKGFSDWEHPDTGAKMLKAQHPEYETIYGAAPSNMANQGYSCADCHMAPAAGDDGAEFSSHKLINPTEDPAISEKCTPCHADLAGQIADWQEETVAREHELAAQIEKYINDLTAKKDSLDADTLAKAQDIHRAAQFYWDYVMVENSEGAHNPSLAQENLDKCEQKLEEGFALLA